MKRGISTRAFLLRTRKDLPAGDKLEVKKTPSKKEKPKRYHLGRKGRYWTVTKEEEEDEK